MSLSNRQRAMGAVAYGMVRGMTEGEIVDRLSDDGCLVPDPQIIRTAQELDALDPDTVVQPPQNEQGEWPRAISAESLQWAMRTWNWKPFPAVVVAEGEHVRACREALEGETT